MGKFIIWLKGLRAHFIADCSLWYKKWSTWLASLWGLVGVVFWNIPTWFPQLVGGLPPETRAALSPVVFIILTGVPILVANLKQKKLQDEAKKLAQGPKQ
jgi:hypothetical protein